MNPFTMSDSAFLTLYWTLLAIAFVLGFVIPAVTRPRGQIAPVSDPDELAMLNGGATRLAETSVIRLLTTDMLTMPDKDSFARGPGLSPVTAIDQHVLRVPMPAKWSHISAAVTDGADAIAAKLVRMGLMIDDDATRQRRLIQTMPYFLLIGLGLLRMYLGIVRGEAIGWLLALLVVATVCAVSRFGMADRRTAAGLSAVRAARGGARRLATAPTRHEMDMAVALFGTAVLVGSIYEPFHQARAASNDSGSGDGSSSDGGGCGGGCGGCGG